MFSKASLAHFKAVKVGIEELMLLKIVAIMEEIMEEIMAKFLT